MKKSLILFSVPSLILAGCASTGMDTVYVKNNDEIVAIEQTTVQEDNMSVLSIETTVTDNKSVVITTGNPEAYVESVTEGGNSLRSLEEAQIEGLGAITDSVATVESDTLANATTPPPSRRLVLFKTNDADINPEDFTILAEHALYLLENPEARLVINGHADNRGNAEYNQKLSENRAKAVADTLLEMGVQESQLTIHGFGATTPVIDPSNWQANRRVELTYDEPTILTKR
jgi:peptidoglycan-associated lipoprotein